jgi:hypothetical protein
MKRLKAIASLIMIIGILFLTRCDKSADACPDGMVKCYSNGNYICVPKSIGC